MEFLRAILGDKFDEFAQLINDHNSKNKGKEIKLADLGTGEYVSKGKYSALEAEHEDAKEQLKTANSTITTLKKENKDNEELQKTIKTHEATIQTMKQDFDEKIKEMKLTNAINAKLTDTKYADLLVTKFDRSKLTIADDGETVLGIDEQLKTIKETYSDLFTAQVKGKPPVNNSGSNPAVKNPWSKEHFNLTEQAKILKENPELAKQLMNV